MRLRSLVAVLVTTLGAGAAAPTAGAAIAWAPCTPAGFQCAHLPVPLDPSGATPGTLALSLKRTVSASNPTRSAVVALAGGPGQAAIPFAAKLIPNIAPALATRDLLVFDQRGTGESGKLSCRAIDAPGIVDRTAGACARELGPNRAFYRTTESVDDIEAIRREAGYDKLVLYGTSYGTKVATAYAARYPDRVEALVLDSVVLPEGPDVFDRSSFQAVGPALRRLCGAARCRGITGDPRGDVATLVRRLEDRPIRGPVTTASGATARRTLTAIDLFDILLAGDFDPTLRADFPAAVRSALRGDVRPILRLEARASGGDDDGSIAATVLVTTVCEEALFPWDRSADAATRAVSALRAARTIPRAQFGPFDARVGLLAELIPFCAGWPNAAPAPSAAPVALPAVPTLILDGQVDLRTPVTDARALAARIPGARLVEVPFTGHSVLGADTSGCARGAVAAFFGGRPIAACTAAAPQFRPTPIPPTRLSRVGGDGRARKTINAVRETLADVTELVAGDAASNRRVPRAGTRFAGLRGGSAAWTATGISFRSVSYVPGVVVSGFAPRRAGATIVLRVTGSAGAHGTVRVHPDGSIVAILDGRRLATGARPIAAPARAAARIAAASRGFRADDGVW